ncbi:Uncharacterised protein [Campylobacter jejuni]|nr:Uncharacterised protein [Campylobacter jejuni]
MVKIPLRIFLALDVRKLRRMQVRAAKSPLILLDGIGSEMICLCSVSEHD